VKLLKGVIHVSCLYRKQTGPEFLGQSLKVQDSKDEVDVWAVKVPSSE
jgi:hypothetical protein